jgi:type I restriction enzyme R subunit
MVLEKRTRFVARKVWEYLSQIDPYAKTIIFCEDQEHAERMRQELVKLIPEAASNRKYVMRITGDDTEGKAQLSYFIDNDEKFPVIATTSKLLTTGVDAKTCKLIVLDQNIFSMTEFKQILGRGTRLREDYNKLYFTIMDFKGATRLFADPDFDGEPVVIYEPKEDDPIVPPEDLATDETKDLGEPEPSPYDLERLEKEDDEPRQGRSKYYVDDVEVNDGVVQTRYLDADGKLITEDLRDYSRRKLKEEFGSLKDFLKRWNETDRKQKILQELEDQGIPIDLIKEAVPKSDDFDVFDLVAHIAFDQKPLTRQERADKVKKRNYFGKYGDQARAVLESLLDKYADHGIADIEDPKVLELPPFDQYGTKTQIRRGIFGGPEKFTQALSELEQVLYQDESA